MQITCTCLLVVRMWVWPQFFKTKIVQEIEPLNVSMEASDLCPICEHSLYVHTSQKNIFEHYSLLVFPVGTGNVRKSAISNCEKKNKVAESARPHQLSSVSSRKNSKISNVSMKSKNSKENASKLSSKQRTESRYTTSSRQRSSQVRGKSNGSESSRETSSSSDDQSKPKSNNVHPCHQTLERQLVVKFEPRPPPGRATHPCVSAR